MKESLDQQRARFAWEKVQRQDSEYTKLAKGAPALIMQSGLMPVLAFLNEKARKEKEKKEKPHTELLEHLCAWLNKRFRKGEKFEDVMNALVGDNAGDASGHAQFYRLATEETLAILRWIRQFAAAVARDEEGGSRHG